MIKAKIDITKLTGVKIVAGRNKNPDGSTRTYLDITDCRLFKGKPNRTTGEVPYYLDLVMHETAPTNFGDFRDENTHMIVEDMSKEERAAGKKGAILGNAKDTSMQRKKDQPQSTTSEAPAETTGMDTSDDDVPF